jgi:hypothetical protein
MLGRLISGFNRIAPKISRGIGQVGNIARNIGQGIQHVRTIGSTVNQMSGGRIGNSPFGQKMAEITDKINNVADNVANQEPNAHNFVSTIARKVNA